MAASYVDEKEEIEKRLEWQQLCWNENNMGVSSDYIERENERQGLKWSVVETQEEERS